MNLLLTSDHLPASSYLSWHLWPDIGPLPENPPLSCCTNNRFNPLLHASSARTGSYTSDYCLLCVTSFYVVTRIVHAKNAYWFIPLALRHYSSSGQHVKPADSSWHVQIQVEHLVTNGVLVSAAYGFQEPDDRLPGLTGPTFRFLYHILWPCNTIVLR